MSRQARLRVGIAGAGVMGRNHLRILAARDDVAVAAIAEPDADTRGAALLRAPDARGFEDPLAMIAEERLDAVIIATPTTLHHAVASMAIERGIAVLVEKPLAATIDDAVDLVAKAASHGGLVQVGHVERFNPAVRALYERLQEGALSRIYSVRTIRAGPMPDRVRDVGVAIDLATHDADLLCHLLDSWPLVLYAQATGSAARAEHLLYGLLTFPGGVLAQLDVNWLTPEKQRGIVVLGEEGMFEVDNLHQWLTFTRGTADLAPVYLDGYAPTIAGETVHLPVRPREPLRVEIDAFLEAVRTGGSTGVSATDGLRAVIITERMRQSAATGAAVELDGPQGIRPAPAGRGQRAPEANDHT